MYITNQRSVVIFDETGWGNTVFSSIEIFKNLLDGYQSSISRIEFLNIERGIIVYVTTSATSCEYYCFHGDLGLLNFLCRYPKFYKAVKEFFMTGTRPVFSASQYPFLAAVILGDNNGD